MIGTDFLSNGLYIDENNQIRIVDPKFSQKTSQLNSDSNEFTEKIQFFQRIVDNFNEIIEVLAQNVEKEKIKAVGSRNLLKSVEKRQNSDKQQLNSMIKEKSQQLMRLNAQLDSLVRYESQQTDIIQQMAALN